MTAPQNDPRYAYADILIALANADEDVHADERALLDGIFETMELDPDVVRKMWLTPRTLDVAEAMVETIEGDAFKRCLLKDCYLLAYADTEMGAQENRFIRKVRDVLGLRGEEADRVHEWVRTAIRQQQQADELFGAPF